MRCTSCASSFRFSAWILQCGECKEQYCTNCMRRVNGIYYCERCGILIRRPPDISELMKLKAKDLQEYLKRHNIPTLGIVEKRELVELLCNHAIPVKNTKTSTVINKIFTNFETVFLNGDNRQSPATSPTTASSTTNRTTRSPPPLQQQHSSRSSFFPCSSSTNLNFSNCNSFNTTDDNRNHTLPKENRSQQARAASPPPPPPQSQTQSESSSPLPKRFPKLSDYRSAEDLTNLSSKELKILLTLYRVDYKGCVEKSELLEKAEMLWIDNYRQKCEELPNNFEDLCKLCMDAPLDCVLLECGHIATCVDCGKKLAECPICRQYVTRVVRTFKA